MAKIIGTALMEHRPLLQGMNDSALAAELRALVASGHLEHRGFPDEIHFCEVRLAGGADAQLCVQADR